MSLASAQAVHAMCRAMYAQLLNRGDYDILLNTRSIRLIADYLKKETPYAYVLRKIDSNNVHRGQLEQVFKKSLFYDYEKLLKFSAGDYKFGIQAMFFTHEIDDLKLVIGSVCSAEESHLTAEDLIFVKHYSAFTPAQILSAGAMDVLVENLKDTRYYKALLPFAVRENPNFLRIDNALNLLNFRTRITTYQKHLSGPSKAVALAIYGTKADIENILFIYRIKKLYRFPVADILSGLIPYYHKISSRELLELAESDTLPRLTALIAKTYYGFLFPAGRERSWETLYMEFLYKIHHRNLRMHGGDIGVAFSYLFLKETDIRNIITIIEGVRYALPTKEIAEFLIGYGADRPPG
jgi:V/A-type H+-transporting ATPase subunit C